MSTDTCTFTGNQAGTDAILSALQNTGYNDISSSFSQNIATGKHCFGSINQGSGTILNGSKFIGNSVTGSGGILIYNLFNSLTLTNVEVKNNIYNGGVKNLYVIASTITVTNSQFNSDSPVSSTTDTSRGGYLHLFGCDVTLTSSQFVNGRSGYGAALYIFGSTFSSESCTFEGNQASISGGAIYALILSQFTSFKDKFVNNKAPLGDSFGMSNINDYLNIKNGTFNSDIPAQFISAQYSSINLEYNVFEQLNGHSMTTSTDLRDGSAILIDSTVRISAHNNQFKNMINKNGVVTINENQAAVTIASLYPTLYKSGTKLVSFQSNTFDSCKSYGTEGGGAIYYDCGLTGCQLYLNNDVFQNNFASNVGGAIYWTYDNPVGINTCTFTKNTAIVYGEDVAAIPHILKVVSESYYNANINSTRILTEDTGNPYPNLTITDIRSGGTLPTLYIGIFDIYGKLMKSMNDEILRFDVTGSTSDKYKSFLTAADTVAASKGLFKVENVGITATPGTNQTVKFTTSAIDESIPSNADYLSANSLSTSGISFTVSVRECIAGEAFLDNGECEPCTAELDYSIVKPTTETACTPCPLSYAKCLGGSSIVPIPGYWKANNITDVFYKCNNYDACLGYSTTEKDPQGS